jgi:hypothetical protein
MKAPVYSYTFNAAAKTITFTGLASIALERIYAVINCTTQQIIYNPADQALGGTVATNVLTLETATTGMGNSDKLLILYDRSATEDYMGDVGLTAKAITATMTRPSDVTAYAAGDVISNSTTAPVPITLANMTRAAGGILTPSSLWMTASSTAFVGPVRVHFYSSSPAAGNDNTAFTTVSQTDYLGFCTVNLANVGGRALGVVYPGNMPVLRSNSSNGAIYALLEAGAAMTPTSAMLFALGLTGVSG